MAHYRARRFVLSLVVFAAFGAIWELVARARRRYGGYIVHAGIIAMFLGFTGGAYKVDQEFSMHQGESIDFGGYHITYVGPRRVATDPAKMELYIDLDVSKNGKYVGRMTPARFIYTRQQMPTSEVAPAAITAIRARPTATRPASDVRIMRA